jgi:hypothetical protein
VIALVSHYFFDPAQVHLWLLLGPQLGLAPDLFRDLFTRFRERLIHRCRVALIAGCSVTATTAPVSRSTACSALCARCVRPSFIFAIRASSSAGLFHSSFGIRFFRLRSSRVKSSRVGVAIPDARASPRKNSS